MTRLLTTALLALILLPTPAQSRECARYGIRTIHREWPQYSYRERFCKYWARDDDYREPRERVYGYERRSTEEEDSSSGRVCRDERRAVGDQHLTLEGAKKAANDSWAATIRFHIGEKWLDLNNARHIVYTCSRSSIKEGGVTTLGQILQRCELKAQPCAPLPERERREEER